MIDRSMYTIRTGRPGEFMTRDRERTLADQHLERIRAIAGSRVEPDDIHIRGMLLCNSERDHYYSRFAPDALNEVAALVPGRPVMVGHDYGSLPIARYFHAERKFLEEGRKPRRDCYHVEALYYLPRDPEGDAIARRIDLGIYSEASAAWRCVDASCSMCHNHINDRARCDHIPGEVYDDGICDFEFSGITAFMEGSLVFAGGQKGTHTFNPAGERGAAPAAAAEQGSAVWWNRFARDKHLALAPAALERQLRAQVATVICGNERFETAQDAAQWARDHDFRVDRADQMDSGFRFRQFDAAQQQARRIRLDDYVHGEVARPNRRDASDELTFERFSK